MSSGNANFPIDHFVQDPSGRGTFNLLLSCLLTLLLCVWSALHLNVPGKGEPISRSFYRNILWITPGVYAPELVVFTAWRQWSSAKILTDIVKNSGYDLGETRQNSWTNTHSFFGCTGGFAFDVTHFKRADEQAFLPPYCPDRLTLTAKGVSILAHLNLLPDIPVEDIQDKSKANHLAKTLIMLQAIWMLLQVIGRALASLPITLLELNTVAHVLCALSMYVLWWHKPLLPTQPLIIRGTWVAPLCAYMYMVSEISGFHLAEAISENADDRPSFMKYVSRFRYVAERPEVELVSLRNTECERVESRLTEPERRSLVFTDAPLECQQEIEQRLTRTRAETAFFERKPRAQRRHVRNDGLDKNCRQTARRWQLAAEAIIRHPFLMDSFTTHTAKEGKCLHPPSEELLVVRVGNWPSEDLLRNVGGLTVGMILWMSNFFYGGLHATAWNGFFPTTAERWLWRSSAVYISFCGGLWIVINYAAQKWPPLNRFWDGWMHGHSSWLYKAVLGTLVVCCGLAFVIARAFIVIEAFISIRVLPRAAYETPSWSQIIPHIS